MARINGTSGIDTLSGTSSASDRVYGLAGADTLTANGTKSDVLFGGDGIDTFNIQDGTHTVADFTTGETLNVDTWATAIVTGVLDFTGSTVNNNGTIVMNGTSSADTIVGSAGKDSITAGSGNDDVTAAAGDDTLLGGSGADTLNGGAGADSLDGGTGNDSLTGGADADTFNVSSGTDTITDLGTGEVLKVSSGATANATVTSDFTAADTTVNNGRANLTLDDGGVDATLTLATGSAGFSVTAAGNTSASTIIGSSKADTITGGAVGDNITGGKGNDSLTGGTGNDTFNVDAGTDTITDFGTGTDVLVVTIGATANVTVVADYTATGSTQNSGTANLTLTSDADTVNLTSALGGFKVTASNTASNVTGGTLNDSITGGTGNDTLSGGASGDDTLVGGAGNDSLTVANGTDSLTGGAGVDTFTVSAGTATITDLGNGADVLVVTGGTTNANVSSNFTATAATSHITGGTVTLTQGKGVSIIDMDLAVGTLGYTIVKGSSGTLKATGSDFADTFQFASKAQLASATVAGGTGDDILKFSGAVTLVDKDFRKVTAVETLQLSNTASSVTLGSNSETAGIDTVIGGNGDDVINAAASTGSKNLQGGAGKDWITGSNLGDVITGGAGADVIDGGAGADTISFGDTLVTGDTAGDAGDLAGSLASDTITFVVADDTFQLSETIFGTMGNGASGAGAALNAAQFNSVAGTNGSLAALGIDNIGNGAIVYDTTNNDLYFIEAGVDLTVGATDTLGELVTATNAIKIADVTLTGVLTAADFAIVA